MRPVVLISLAVAGAAHAQARPAAPAPATPAAPIGQWTPVPELPGMGRPVDTGAVAARRRALLRRVGRGIVLIPAAHQRDVERDYVQDNDFRQNNYFYYFTGLETADAWLVMVAWAPDSSESTLLLPARDPRQERWTGLRLGPDSTAVRLSGIGQVVPLDSLESVLSAARFRRLAAAPEPIYALLDETTGAEPRIQALLFESGRDVRNLRPLADSLRLVKDAEEVARLRRAIDITVRAQIAAMEVVRPGLWEYQLESVIELTFRWNGADRVGFPSIVGSGPNSTTLHYDVNRRQLQDGDLVVIDVGAEWGQYTADVTRTIPVSGKFTPRQKAIYDLVLATQQAAFEAVRPGVTLRELDRLARNYLRDHSGSVCGMQTCDAYFVHGLSHWLGLDVHDVGDYSTPLQPGMVFTIEPGVYLPAEELGVRIEDDVLMTASGAEWLSARAPRTTEEIERLMQRRASGGQREREERER